MTWVFPRDSLKSFPPALSPDYKSTVKRSHTKPLVVIPHTLSELTGPVYGHERCAPATMTLPPNTLANRSVSASSCVDGYSMRPAGRPQRFGRGLAGQRVRSLIGTSASSTTRRSIRIFRGWTHGNGQDGAYKFITIQPGAYPWANHPNAWRPAHIHFSVFGPAFLSRLVTQAYFPGDPLFRYDPIFQSVAERRRASGWCPFSIPTTRNPNGRSAFDSTSCCAAAMPRRWRPNSVHNQTARHYTIPDRRPFLHLRADATGQYECNDAFTNNLMTADASGERIRIEGRVFDGDGKPVPDCMLEIWQADAQGRFADPQDKRALPNSKFRGYGRCGTGAIGEIRVRHHQAGAGRRSRRQAAGAAYSRGDFRPRHALA